MADINLRIILSALGAQPTVSAISSIGNSMGGLNKAILGLGVAAAGLAIGLGVTAIKAAGDFQTSLTTLSTGAGESAKNLKMVGDGILSLATQTGTSTKQLTDGMYMIESSGYHGKAGLDVLAAAARGARVGNADLGTVSDATTTIMTDFANKNVTASQAVNDLIAVVSNGKTTMGALSSSLSQILPTASAAGISLTDTSAAMATMTGEGIPAANAATYLRQTIIGLQAPSKQTTTALADIGLKSKDVSDEMKVSLPGALQMITDHLKKKFPEGSAAYVNALKDISGGSKTMQGMLDLTGQHLATFKGNVVNITGAVKQGGSSINGWAQVQQNFNFKMDQAKEAVNVLMIKIGQALLPVVTQLMGAVIPLISQFSDWVVKSGALQNGINFVVNTFKTLVAIGSNVVSFFQHNTTAMEALKVTGLVVAGVIITSLVVGFYAWAAAAGAAAITTLAATWPILAIGAAIGLLVGGFILAYNHIQPFHDAVNGIAQAISSNFLPVLHMIGNFLSATFAPVWQQLVSVFNTQIQPSIQQLIGTFHQVEPELKIVAMVVGGVLVAAFGLLVGVVSGIVGGIAGVLRGLAIAFGGVVQVISGIIQIISGYIAFIVDLFTGHFGKLGGDLKTIFHGYTQIFSGFGNIVKGIFTGIVGGVMGSMSGFATGVLGYFNQIVHGAENHTQHTRDVTNLHTLQMKDQSVKHVIDMAQLSVAHMSEEAAGLEKQIAGAKDVVVKHHLEMKLKSVQHAMDAKVGTIQQYQEMKTGVDAQVTQAQAAVDGKTISMATAAKLNTLKMKDDVLKNAQDMQKGQLKILDQQAKDVEDQFKKAKDSATKHKLQEKYTVIQHQIEEKKGVLQHTTEMRTQVESQLDSLKKGASDRFGSIQKDIQRIVGDVTKWVKDAWKNTVDWVVGRFEWLYFHNYYFRDLVDSIKKAFVDAENWIHTTWNNISSWLSGKWNDLVKMTQDLWKNISKPFQDAWGQHISPALSGLWDNVSAWFSDVSSQAVTFGEGIINSLAQGIRNAAGAVGKAASDVAQNIKNFLGFHSPALMGPAGPGEADVWMKNFMVMISGQMVANIPLLQNALNLTAGTISKSMTAIADPRTVADQLSFSQAPTQIYQSNKGPVDTRAVKHEAAQDKKEAKKAAEEKKKEERKAAEEKKKEAAAEKKHVHADIKEIKAELHIHTTNAKLDKAQIDEIINQAMHQFGRKIGDEIRAQFGNI